MQFIATNTFVPSNLVKPTKPWINGFRKKTLVPFGMLMAFLLSGVMVMAQCPSPIEGSVLTASTNPILQRANVQYQY